MEHAVAMQPSKSEMQRPDAADRYDTSPARPRPIMILGYCGMIALFVISVILLIRIPLPSANIAAVVVPHHDIVKHQRQEFWRQLLGKIDAKAIKRIIIIGPDHFGENQRVISYDNTDWTTSNLTLKNLLSSNSKLPNAFQKNTGLIKSDHAIVNLIGEVKQNFPNARFTPFLIGRNVKFKDLGVLSNYLNTACGRYDCLLITSVDFSHYLKESVAQAQDKRTVGLLANKTLNQNSLNQHGTIEADSPQSLYVLQEFARVHGLNYWWLQNQTNSAFGDPNTTDTTSHVFAGYLKH